MLRILYLTHPHSVTVNSLLNNFVARTLSCHNYIIFTSHDLIDLSVATGWGVYGTDIILLVGSVNIAPTIYKVHKVTNIFPCFFLIIQMITDF